MTAINLDWFHFNQMQANPEKFQGIAIGKKSHETITSLKLKDTPIVFEDEVKLLGITIDFKLNFDTHISNICKKASRQLNCLKRLGKFLTRLGRLTVYHSFILSNFNYCPLTWHFCSEANTKKMERIQERALRFIYDDHNTSYEDLLMKSKLPSLKLRRIRTMALESFKIINKDCPVILQDLLTVKHNRYNFRYHNTVEVPHARTTRFGLQSFRHKATATWNSLPDHVRCMSTFNLFKSFISNLDGPNVNAWHAGGNIYFPIITLQLPGVWLCALHVVFVNRIFICVASTLCTSVLVVRALGVKSRMCTSVSPAWS